jgi:hypothetical protein
MSELVGESRRSDYVKTHAPYRDEMRGEHIYIERNVEDVIVSYAAFNQCARQEIWKAFGLHCDHVASWKRAGALWLRFEELKTTETLERLSEFVGQPIRDGQLPSFAQLHEKRPWFFRSSGFTEEANVEAGHRSG